MGAWGRGGDRIKAEASRAPNQNYPEVLESLRSIVETQLLEGRIEPRRAAELAEACIVQVRLDWGGQNVYVPMMSRAEIADRNKSIVAMFNGSNALELSRKHGLSIVHLRRILAARRDKPSP